MDTKKLFNLDAEREIIGSILVKNDVLCDVIGMLKAADFYADKHKILYATMVKMYEESKPIEMTTLIECLGNNLTQAGGITYFTELAGSIATTQNINSYVEIIKEKANTRELIKTLTNALNKANSEDLKAKDIIDYIQENTLKISEIFETDNGDSEEAINRVLTIINDRNARGGDIQGIKTTYSKIDKTLNGLNKQDFIIVAARPSMGKTAFSVNLALNTAIKSKARTAFFSLEMSKEQVLERGLAAVSNIYMDNIKKGDLKGDAWTHIVNAGGRIATKNFKIYDKIFSLNGIKAECKKLKIQGGLDVVVIDYLGLIDGSAKAENRNQEISKISRSLKLFAKELDITIICLSQLSRAPEQRADHRPQLSDLRESGSIEQDADIVMFLYRDEYYKPDTEDKNVIECIIAKNRNGELGTIKLRWMPEYQKIGELAGFKEDGNYDPKVFERK